jgi:polyhydroxyalkanoate synthesis repressor PhaR
MLVIKRYPNRKLYDTEAKRYVTLEGIAELIQRGEELHVVDHETGEDLTTVTLSQIIFEQEKKRAGFLPKSILSNLIRTGSDTLDYLWRSFQASTSAVRLLEQEINRRLDALVERGELAVPEADRLRAELARFAPPSLDHKGPEAALEESILGRLNIPTRADILALQAQLEALTVELESLMQARQGPSTVPAAVGNSSATKEISS